jgi:hypothetical protein
VARRRLASPLKISRLRAGGPESCRAGADHHRYNERKENHEWTH